MSILQAACRALSCVEHLCSRIFDVAIRQHFSFFHNAQATHCACVVESRSAGYTAARGSLDVNFVPLGHIGEEHNIERSTSATSERQASRPADRGFVWRLTDVAKFADCDLHKQPREAESGLPTARPLHRVLYHWFCSAFSCLACA